MITPCNLNTYSSWKLLPWIKINTRILLLQKKIFEAARECNRKKIHKIQNYLLNCHEAKVIAIENIINKINNSYDQQKYYFTEKEKFHIFKLIFCHTSEIKYLKNKLVFMIEKIRQYLIYLCLEPEWKARIEPSQKNNLYLFDKYIFQCNKYFIKSLYKQNILYLNHFIYDINKENFNLYNTLNKIQSLPYINMSIKYWIQNKYLIHCNTCVLLINLLYRISLIGLDWYQLKMNKLSKKYKYLKSRELRHSLYFKNFSNLKKYFQIFIFGLYSININHEVNYIKNIIIQKKIYNKIILEIKYKLYIKNYLNKLRSKTSLTLNKVKNIIIKQIKLFYSKYYLIINKKIINNLLKVINIIIYYWYMNKNSNNINNCFEIKRNFLYIFIYNHIFSKILFNYSLKINR